MFISSSSVRFASTALRSYIVANFLLKACMWNVPIWDFNCTFDYLFKQLLLYLFGQCYQHNIMSPTSGICHQPGSRPGTDEEIVAANHGGSARFGSLSWGILGETMGIHVVHMFFKLLKCWKFTSSPKHDEIIWPVITWFDLPSGKWSKQWGAN